MDHYVLYDDTNVTYVLNQVFNADILEIQRSIYATTDNTKMSYHNMKYIFLSFTLIGFSLKLNHYIKTGLQSLQQHSIRSIALH
ncbi:hypothetical protein Pcar_3345 [Syntrophotalea carbinolica DSM 2380]|uniref:Uncharacterized protein n=1 Tax=Syntrophotalea carbinolica (strain DSM 2380 / NBRC 103641 / GraBd1) TaxID=338963 RepID=Q0C6H7_SYNC1|nr:hypothetical protein Pcar_3345 [Syntrophotalea carbinolica DSM 2380]